MCRVPEHDKICVVFLNMARTVSCSWTWQELRRVPEHGKSSVVFLNMTRVGFSVDVLVVTGSVE
jgi:hypothetical protein